MAIQLNSRPLKYQAIEAELRRFVAGRQAGEKLPSERELAQAFQCNVLTVRRGLSALVAEGLVVRRPGSGTFIAKREGPPAAAPEAFLPGSRHRLGALISHDGDAYAHKVTQAVALAARREAVDLRSAWIHDYGDEALQQAETLKAGGCTALVLPWFPPHLVGKVESFVRKSPLPVSLPQLIAGLEGNCFEKPEVFGKSMLAATEGLCHYFRRLGHGRIAFLGPNASGNIILQAKLAAYSCYVSREGLENLSGLVGETAGEMDALARRWQIFRGDLAVISYDDTHALRLVTAMHKLGLAAPMDFSIVGYNNIEASQSCDPPLSTVCQNFDYLGTWLVKSALALAAGRREQSAEVAPLHLLIRHSCGGRAAAGDLAKAGITGLVMEVDPRVAALAPGVSTAVPQPALGQP
ncbi:MAG: substrate-binding domain-containing protein [Lentisphaeria bacterium]